MSLGLNIPCDNGIATAATSPLAQPIANVQVNGKRRDEISLPKGLERQDVEDAVLALDTVRRALGGKPVRRVVVVPDRIANVVSG